MIIELQGFGTYLIDENRYVDFTESLNLSKELSLSLRNISKDRTPILCISTNEINSEGNNILELGYFRSNIGYERFYYLIENEIIFEIN